MSQVIRIQPLHQETHWLLNLRINQQRNRVTSCLHKIERLFHQSRQGTPAAILELYSWYQSIRQVEGYYDKEIARLSKLIHRKVKDDFEYRADKTQTYRLPITTPISASLYHIITKFDTLMCLSETCLTLSIFKHRQLFARKSHQYKQSIIHVITQISHHKLSKNRLEQPILDDQKERLAIAIRSDVMPMLTKPLFEALDKLTQAPKT